MKNMDLLGAPQLVLQYKPYLRGSWHSLVPERVSRKKLGRRRSWPAHRETQTHSWLPHSAVYIHTRDMEQRHTDINTETIICLRVDQVRGFRVLSEPFNTHELTESFTPSLFINTHFASHLWQKYKGPKVPGGNAPPPNCKKPQCMYVYVCTCVCMYTMTER